jgi:hypothetical protein
MKTVTFVPSNRTVEIPTTSDDWHLYTSSKTRGVAARVLTGALLKVLRKIDHLHEHGGCPAVNVLHLYESILRPVMIRYAEYGAFDAESRRVALNALEKAYERITGRRVDLGL